MSNKYTYSVPFTEEGLYQSYVVDGMTQQECAKKYGTSQHVVQRAMKKMKIPARVAAKRDQRGDQNTSWKGGRVLVNYKTPNGHRYLSVRNSTKGYYMIRMPNHIHAQGNGYVFEHLVVALNAAGKTAISENECVHHIDFVKTNNSPENLVICTKDKHREYHGNLGNLVGEMLDAGIVGFDVERGYFRVK